MFKNTKKNENGFVVLYAIIVASLVAMLGAGLFSVALRQSSLSRTASESIEVFYIADSGIECILDAHLESQDNGLGGIVEEITDPGYTVTECEFGDIEFTEESTDVYTGSFEYSNEKCGAILILDNVYSDPNYYLQIVSRGFNECNGDEPIDENPLLIERRMRASFPITAP
jgi:hypothetical protein